MAGMAVELVVEGNAIDAVSVGQEAVIAELVPGDQKDYQRGAQADGQAKHVDDRKDRVAPEAAKGGDEVVSKHKRKTVKSLTGHI